jgi:hypothetical protein
MRTKLFATLLVALLFSVTVAAIGTPRSALAQETTPAVCTDEKFKEGIAADFKTSRDSQSSLDMTKAADVVKQALLISLLRQKYEDSTVAPECFQTNLIVIVYLANVGDNLMLRLAQMADPENKDLEAAGKAQDERNQKYLDMLVKSVEPPAAATEAP